MNDEVISAHRERQQALIEESQTLIAKAQAEARDLTEEEQATVDGNTEEFDRLRADIERRERLHAQAQSLAKVHKRKAEAEPLGGGRDDDGDRPAPGLRAKAPAQPRPAGEAGRGGFTTFPEYVAAVRKAIHIPLAIKVGPYFTSFGHFARRIVDAGADGLVIFNRYIQPDINLETLDFFPNLALSESYESRLSMTWIAMLRGRVGAYLAATGGIHEVADLIKMLLVGADAAMLASAIYRHGPGHFTQLEQGLRDWLVEKDYTSVQQMKGSLSRENCTSPETFERVNYMRSLVAFSGRPI